MKNRILTQQSQSLIRSRLRRLPIAPGAAADDFNQDALDRDPAGVKCVREVALRFDRHKGDFGALAGVDLQPEPGRFYETALTIQGITQQVVGHSLMPTSPADVPGSGNEI